MTDPGVVAALGIEGVQWVPGSAEQWTVRVSGRWRRRRPSWAGQPLLVVEAGGQRHRFPAMPEPPSLSGAGPGMWRMIFSVPVADVPEPPSRSWLQLGAMLVPLPRELEGSEPVQAPSPLAASPAPSSPPPRQATARALAAEGAAAELASRILGLERDLDQREGEIDALRARLAERERAVREARQDAHAEEMLRRELGRERDEALAALERGRTQVQELEEKLTLLRRRVDEAEHLAAAAWSAARSEDARPRAPAGPSMPARAPGILAAERASVHRVPPHPGPAAAILPRPADWSSREREHREARSAPRERPEQPSAELSATLEALRGELAQLSGIAQNERALRFEAEALAARRQEEVRVYAERCARAYDAVEGLRDQLDAVRVVYAAIARPGGSSPPIVPSNAAVPPSEVSAGQVERERLDAALRRLRETSPLPEDADVPEAEQTAAHPWLLGLFRALVGRDEERAGRLLLELLPAQALVHPEPIAYDLVLGDQRCVCVSVEDGRTRLQTARSPRPLTDVRFRVLGPAAAIARLLVAGPLRRRLGRRRLARIAGDRSGLQALRNLFESPLALVALARAGVDLEQVAELALPVLERSDARPDAAEAPSGPQALLQQYFERAQSG